MKLPQVTVLMPVYNSTLYVKDAINSILNQSFQNFEFIIIDDASTDESLTIIKSFNDPRIQIIEKPANTGYTNSLNIGLALARGEYIARMDSDDISLPERLSKQVAFMKLHPKVGVCGSWIETFGFSNRIRRYKTEHEQIKIELLSRSSFAHPSVILRKAMLDQLSIKYKVESEPAEDYELWVRLSEYCELANIPEVLLRYRIHEKQVTSRFSKQQTRIDRQLKLFQVEKLGIRSLQTDEEFIMQFLTDRFQKNSQLVCRAHRLSIEILDANKKIKIYDQKYLYDFLSDKWACSLNNLLEYSIELLKIAAISPFPSFNGYSKADKVRFIVKCLIGWKTRL